MKINGTVKFFNQEKGFGFIRMGNEDIFVHATQIQGGAKLDQGDEVKFTVGQNNKGQAATEVELVRKSQEKPQRQERRPRDFNARY